MSARKLACDGCRKSKVRCDGQEGVSTCSRCAKKIIDCTWDTPRSKRGRKSHNNRLNTESGMGLFCLTPKNLIELNYTAHHHNPHHHSNNRSPSADPHNHHPVDPASPQPHHSHPHPHPHQQQQGHLPEQHQYYHQQHQTPPGNGSPQVPHEDNWKLPLPLHSRERFMKPKSNSLEGLPSLHKIHLMSPRSQRPRSLDELVVNVNPATPTATNTTTTGTNSTTSSPSTPQHTPHLPHHHHHHPSPSSSSFIPLHHPQTPTSPPSNISFQQHPAPPPSPSLSLPIDIPNNNFEVGKDMELDDSDTEQQQPQPQQPQPQPHYHHHFNIPQQQIMNNGLIFNPSMSPSSSRYNNKLPDSPQAYPHNPMTTSTTVEATAMEPSLQYNHMIIQNSMMNMMIQPTTPIPQQYPLQTLSQEEAVRKKCSIEALINTDQDEDNYPLFQNYPSRK